MPKYYGRNTAVQISVADLAQVITQNPRPKQCPETTSSIANIDWEFAKATERQTLTEEPLNAEDGRHLRFLGRHEDMPFFMVHAGKDFFKPSAVAKGTRRSPKSFKQQTTDQVAVYDSDDGETGQGSEIAIDPTNPTTKGVTDAASPGIPHGLCLTLFLSRASFSHVEYEKGVKKTIAKDVKVDVYFNGQFVDSQIVNHKQFQCSGSRGMKGRVVRFTGQKLSRMIEKPWVFVPPDQHANIATNGLSQGDGVQEENASLRWTAISNALLAEADRVGRDKDDNRRVLGDYLESLALLPMPSEVEGTRKGANAKFGVIDIMVVCGRGQKDGPETSYLTKPTRTRPDRNPTNSDDHHTTGSHPEKAAINTLSPELSRNESAAVTPGPSEPFPSNVQQSNGSITPESSLGALAVIIPGPPVSNPKNYPPNYQMTEVNIVPKTRTEALAIALSLDGSGDEPREPIDRLIGELFPPARSRSALPKRSREPSISSESFINLKKRRKALTYHHVIDNQQTLAEEIQSIAERAVENVQRRTRGVVADESKAETTAVNNSSPSISAPESSTEEVSLIETPRLSKVVALRISPEKLRARPVTARKLSDTKNEPASSRNLLSEPPNLANTVAAGATPTPGQRGSVDAVGTSSKTTPAGSTPVPSRRRKRVPQLSPSAAAFDAEFVIPHLSENCCITYAEPGLVRNVGAVRGGWFKEEGVVMGARFVVG